MITPAQILTATDQRIVELGTEASKRLVEGKQSDYSVSLKLMLLKKAYNNPELTEDERESILYCLAKLSEKFMGPSTKKSGGLKLDSNVVKPEDPLAGLFFIGTGSFISSYWGEGNDINGYL